MRSDCPIKELSIYNENDPSTSENFNSASNQSTNKSFGVSAIMLLSDVKDKYQNTVSAFHNFKQYATSTEGKIKFSLMFTGFAAGCVLSYQSKSNRLWFKRLLPAATFSITAGVCYPYHALAIGKSVSRGIVGTYNGSRVVGSYVYLKAKALKEKMSETNFVEDKSNMEGTDYVIDETGIKNMKDLEVPFKTDEEESESDKSRVKSIVNTDETRSVFAKKSTDNIVFTNATTLNNAQHQAEPSVRSVKKDVKKNPDVFLQLSTPTNVEEKILSLVPNTDSGQASNEDADLYTTRS